MNKDKAFNLACDLMAEHVYDKFDAGLFTWNNCKTNFGKPYYLDDGTPVIELSKVMVEHDAQMSKVMGMLAERDAQINNLTARLEDRESTVYPNGITILKILIILITILILC